MYTDVITLFNRKEGEQGDTWYPSVLRNVHLSVDRAALVAKYGETSADNVMLSVRYKDEDGKIMIGGKQWLPPKKWDAEKNYANTVTFTTGTRFDFFVLGDWGTSDPIHDADFSADTDFYTYLNRTRDYVFAITSAGGPYTVVPHFEIMGK